MATATIDTWLGGSGDWSDPANWSAGVPGPGGIASFGTADGISVGLSAADTIYQLADPVNPIATLAIDRGALTLLNGGTWAGVFVLEPFSQLVAQGQAFVLAGLAELDGVIGGPGTVSVTGSALAQGLILTGSAVLRVAGAIQADGLLTLGTSSADAATLAVAAGGTFELQGDYSILNAGAASVVNAGRFEKAGASGTSYIGASFTNTGTLAVADGTLSLDGGNASLGGAIVGAGELDLRGGGTYALASEVALSVGTLGVFDSGTQVTLGASPTYAGVFRLGYAAALHLNGDAFTLTGAANALGGTIAGAGTLSVQGAADGVQLLLTGGAALSDLGAMTQDGLLNLGTGSADSASLTIAAGAT